MTLKQIFMKKLLVIGGSGLVGGTLIEYGVGSYDIFATYNKNEICNDKIKISKINLSHEPSMIIKLITEINPDVVVHLASHSSVDLCETDHNSADFLHVEVTKNIANICAQINSKLIYLSTEWVFEGELNKKYTEDDIPHPINYYGITKLFAEKLILTSSPNNVVLRTAVIYGYHKNSRFTNWILPYISQNKTVDPFIDQYGTPTLVDDLAKVILKIIDLNVKGLFHATGKTCINRYEFALKLADTFGFDKSLIKPVTKHEKKQDAPRPTSTCLDSQKLEHALDFSFSDIELGVSFIYSKFKNNNSILM
jgi:dTDP-4-dehydrorhamnose reductase